LGCGVDAAAVVEERREQVVEDKVALLLDVGSLGVDDVFGSAEVAAVAG
jgi:hypothetical protein